MLFLKLNGGVGAVLVALAMLVASFQLAMADTTTLVCTYDRDPNAQYTVDLNEAQGIATINYPAGSNPYSGSFPARSIGPFPASFDSKTVTFDNNRQDATTGGVMSYSHYTVDRMTLVLLEQDSSYAPFDQATTNNKMMSRLTCHIGKNQF